MNEPLNLKDWGKVERMFRITCGICNVSELHEHKAGIDSFIEKMCNESWRVSANNGYVHRHCEKFLPASIKAHAKTDTHTTETTNE